MESLGQAPSSGYGRYAGLAGAVSSWLGPVLIGVAGIAMAGWTWGTWPDVQIDFGRELYVPWQLSQGKVLYRDIAHIYGPLSHYFNALLFHGFGIGLQTLVWTNLTLLTFLTALLYWLFSLTASRLAATAACLTFVLLFAFGQYVGIGNYNFVTPYAHEMTHGVILAFASIAIFAVYVRRQRRSALFLSGLAMGLCFLTKPEPFLAGEVALGVGLLLATFAAGGRRVVSDGSWFMAGQTFPPFLAFVLLTLHMSPNQALQGVLGSWLYMFDSRLTGLVFFRQGMGLVNWQGNGAKMLVWAVLFLVVFGTAALLACRTRFRRREEAVLVVAVFVLSLGSLAWCMPRLPYFDGLRPLPLVLVGTVLAFLHRLYCQQRQSTSAEARALTVIQVTLCLFALLLLLKEFLNVRIYHYGFALSMPATLVAVCVLTDWVPRAVRKSGGSSAVFLALVSAVWLAVVCVHLRAVDARISPKTVPIGSGRDTFLSDGRGAFVAAALREIDTRLSPAQTLAVLPEGVILNYLSRRESPTRYVYLLPSGAVGFEDEEMLSALVRRPPDAVVLIHRDTSEYGFPLFGKDYGMRTAAWIHSNYRPTWRIGAIPLVDPGQFGILLLLRKPDTRESPDADSAIPARTTGHCPPSVSP
jgi:hypothetical protein